MTARRGYIGIDRFRIVAALLVVAIHTAPLLSFGVLPDYLFTRVFARLGVPFFFAATGFFLLAPFAENRHAPVAPVLRFVQKTAMLYGASILLYLPVNLYAGHWRGVRTVWQALKMLLVDGTMYHLWYLPAAIFGVLLVWALLRGLGPGAATAIAAALYVVGLLGDSYFGIAEAIPWLDAGYQWIFSVCDYTRNGLFYAPVFLLAGVWAANCRAWPRRKGAFGFGLSLALLLAEGLALFFAGGQRHDSMYIALPGCTFFLMVWLASFKGPSSKALRDASLLVYLIHPWVIALLRSAAKKLGVEWLLVENSVFHYLAVCAVSFAAAGAAVWLRAGAARKKERCAHPKRAWMEIDLNALAHNVRVLQRMLPAGCKLMPAVKGNAYGCGAVPVAKALYRLGIRDFCVASLSEGMELRRHGVRGNILVLGYTRPDDCRLLRRYCLSQTVVDFAHGIALAATGKKLAVHIKVDTGMHRLGERSEQTENLCALFSESGLDIRGIYTQLSRSDSAAPEDIAHTKRQIACFGAVLDAIKGRGFPLPKRHIQCSYGVINYPDIRADYARPGLAVYGIVEEARCIGPAPGLKPVFAVKARVALVKPVYRGESIGYGSAHIADRDMTLAVMAMGYADGLPRCLSGGAGKVLVCGKFAPIVGDICMDQAILDVTQIADVKPGGVAVVIGRCGGEELSVHAFAQMAGTIPNEAASRLGARMERVYL